MNKEESDLVAETFLDNIKYSFNQTVESDWTSQKMWEMILSNVICFHYESDSNNLAIPQFLKVDALWEVEQRIKTIARAKEYDRIIKEQQTFIKPGYLTGEFLYKIILNKMK